MNIIADLNPGLGLPWPWEAIVRLVVAAVLGSLIGAERQHRGRSAGFRTQILVALGSALAMLVSVHFGEVYGVKGISDNIKVDPARVAYGVMGGIGFLGAGAIMRYGWGVRGLTTAASLWCNAAIGLACGFGMMAVAAAAAGLVLLALLGLHKLDAIIPAWSVKTIRVTLGTLADENLVHIKDWLQQRRVKILDIQCTVDVSAGTQTLTYEISFTQRLAPSFLLQLPRDIPGVLRMSVT